MKSIKKVIESLEYMEKKSQKEGYGGDATIYAWRRHVLILLMGKKRKATKYQKALGIYLKKGESIQDAHKLVREEITYRKGLRDEGKTNK